MIVCSSGLATAADLANTYTNSIGMKFELIQAGTFMMGADRNIEYAQDRELPRHQVRISKPFYLGVYEVTQQEWTAVMGNNTFEFKGDNNPVNTISWEDVQEFIKRLNQKEGHSLYRLPTEAEWEYAARAGTTSAYFFGNNKSKLGDYAWYKDNAGYETHPVGKKRPNAWGLYDTLGNVWELTQDWLGETYYANSPSLDPTGPSSGEFRVVRGGGLVTNGLYCRSAERGMFDPVDQVDGAGFRLAISYEGSE
jgi:formylglycine-generating enzyme required for sulfatase activity